MYDPYLTYLVTTWYELPEKCTVIQRAKPDVPPPFFYIGKEPPTKRLTQYGFQRKAVKVAQHTFYFYYYLDNQEVRITLAERGFKLLSNSEKKYASIRNLLFRVGQEQQCTATLYLGKGLRVWFR